MKNIFTSIFFLATVAVFAQTSHTVTVSGTTFSPATLTIQVGDTVVWENVSGVHNVNGSQTDYPGNPEGFYSGIPATNPWTFEHVFTIAGTYGYQCDQHVSLGMTGTIVVEPTAPTGALLITGVFDGPLPGGLPKGIELYALADIPDLSLYAVGSANNGGGSNGEEYTFPATSVSEGEFIYLVNDSASFNEFFGFNADFVDTASNSSVNVNGDDAIELFEDGQVIDVFGEINTDGTGQPWEYLDGWAYRVDGTGPDGSTFTLGNWFFSGVDAFDGQTTNSTSPTPFPIGTYQRMLPQNLTANDDAGSTDINTSFFIDVLANDFFPDSDFDVFEIVTMPANGTASTTDDDLIQYDPDQDFCGDDSLTYRVCYQGVCDTADVSIQVICPVVYHPYSIGIVTTNNANGQPDSLNVRAELQGIVYGVNQRPGGLQFTLIDDNNDGIGVFSNSNDYGYDVTEGDEVIVRGVIGFFSGLTQINADTVILLSSGNSLVQPTVVTELGEATESQLVRINNLEIVDPSDWTNAGSGFNVEVEDGMGRTFQMRIDNDVNIFGTSPPQGRFDLVGIGGQFDSSSPYDDGYQIFPRYQEDIMEIVSVQAPEWAKNVSLFPNPAISTVFLDSEESLDKVTLMDETGKSLKEVKYPSVAHRFNVEDYSAGKYFIRLEKDGFIMTLPLLKQ